LYHSTLGSRVIKKMKGVTGRRDNVLEEFALGGDAPERTQEPTVPERALDDRAFLYL
jgi:hypothetical protein